MPITRQLRPDLARLSAVKVYSDDRLTERAA